MDPTTTTNTTTPVPPSSPSTPPPQNHHTPPNAIMDTECLPEAESIPTNLENLKSLVLKLAGRMLPRHQSLIQRRFDDIFPDELLVPNHPPYADMILTALWELKAEGGCNEEAISNFIENEYRELPWAHATILNHHLKDLCTKGKITMTQDKCYQRCSSIRKPVPAPKISPSPMSTTFSSSSDSLFSSPSSSSSSSFCSSPYHKRKKKNKVKRGGKMVRVRGRGRPRKTIQVGQRGQSIGTIRQKKRGSFCHKVKTEVTSMNVEPADPVYDGQTELLTEDNKKLIVGQKVDEEWNENVNDKGRLRRRKYSDEENVSCEQRGGTQGQERKRQRYNVVWIGRRVQKFQDLLEDESNDDVTEVEEYVDKVKDDNLEKQNDSGGEVIKVVADVAHNQPVEKQHEDILEEQNDIVGEVIKVVADVAHNQLVEKQHEDILEEQNDIVGEVKVVADVAHNQLVENQIDDILEEQKDIGGEQKVVADVEHNQPIENQVLMTICDKECDIIEELKVDADVEQDQQQKHEMQTVDEQVSVMIQCEAQAVVADVAKHDDDNDKEQIWPEKGNEQDESVLQQEQCVENRESEVSEEQQTEINQKEIVLPIDTEVDKLQMHDDVIEHVQVEEDTKVSEGECQQDELNESKEKDTGHVHGNLSDQQDSMMSQTESELKGNEQENSVSQQEECFVNRQAELPEEQQTQVNQKEMVLTIDTEVQQNLEIVQNVSKEQTIVTNKHAQPQDHCTKVDNLQMHEQQTSDVIEHVQLQGDTKVSEDECKQEKYTGLVHPILGDQQDDSMMSQTESEVKGDNKEHENRTQETVTSQVQPQQELKEGSEQRRPLRQGLRSSCKKEEATSNTKKQTPVRRSLRHQKQFQNQMK